jgi:hypothetical protein
MGFAINISDPTPQGVQNRNILLSANQFCSLIDMKRKFINSDNHKFHQYQ